MPFQIIIDVKSIRDKIDRFSLPKAQNVGLKKAKTIVDKQKEKFLEAFEDDEISKEIKSGPGKNTGLDGQNGNLFSFIGFDAGSDPVGDLHYYFSNVIKLVRRDGIYNKYDKTLTFKMSLPSEEGIKNVTDLADYTTENNQFDYGHGNSWAFMIERGTIPNLDRYKFSTVPKELGGESRSGTGLIRKNIIHDCSNYAPRKYLTELLKILVTK